MFRIFTPLYILLFLFAVFYSPLQDRLINTFSKEEAREDTIADFEGGFFMAEKLLTMTPESQWPTLLENMSATNIPVRVLTYDEIELTDEGWTQIQKGHHWVSDLSETVILKKLAGRELLLQFGPVAVVDSLSDQVWATFFSSGGVLVLLGLAWTVTVQRRIQHLSSVNKAFGQGNWAVRASESSRLVVGELNKSFNRMAEQIQQLFESHKSLTNAVSHELRTPISRIQFELEFAQTHQTLDEAKVSFDSIAEDARELDRLVSELLTLAKYERSELALVLTPQSLSDWLLGWQATYRFPGAKKELSVLPLRSEELCAFNAEAMARALDNLVNNASRYAVSHIRVTASFQAHTVRLFVEDDGPGIPPEHRERLLKPFERVDKSRSRDTGGFGLGLSIVQQIMKRHAGEVRIEVAALGGAKMILEWPK